MLMKHVFAGSRALSALAVSFLLVADDIRRLGWSVGEKALILV